MTIAVALMMLPILMIATLVLDLGSAGLLQTRMQTATDLAAREGPLGWRGAPADLAWCADAVAPGCDPATQATAWDANRRAAAIGQIASLHAPGAAGAPRVGAPTVPTLALGGGLSLPDPSALALVTGSVDVFAGAAPIVANAGDAPDGDLVGGRFVGRGTPAVPSCLDPNVFEPFGENCLYERSDFLASSASPGDNRSFLVRLRMTGEASQAGVAQPGISVPVLFGRFVGTPGDPAAPPLRTQGLRIRSTSIGDARPALAAAAPTGAGAGTANFGVDLAVWSTLVPDAPAAITEDPATGTLGIGGTAAAGRVLSTPVAAGFSLGAAAAPVAGVVAQPGPGTSTVRYVPLYRAALDGVPRIVGFGVADLEAGAPPRLVKRRARIEANGLTATPDLRASLAGLASPVIDDLFAEYRLASACDPADGGLALVCAGVLVR